MSEVARCQRLVDLCNSRDIPILQVNGQRLTGPPNSWTGPPPERGCEVFVGRIPRDMFEDVLVPLFERAGPLYQMRLMMDFSGTNRGFAFVQFQNRASADKAIATLDGFQVRPGCQIGVVRSAENCRLFLGNLPPDKTREEIHRELSRRVNGVCKVFLYPQPEDRTRNRGYAFVEFENHRAAALARRELMPGGSATLWGQRLRLDWAVPEPVVDDVVMEKVTNLYIRNLNIATTEDAILQAFEAISGPQSINKVKRIKDFAFIHFNKREDAQKNLDYWNEREFNGSVLEVTWAKPVNKLQYVKDKIPNRFNSDYIHTGRPIMKSVPPRRGDSPNHQSNLGLDNINYTAAAQFVPFTMPEGLTMPLHAPVDVQPMLAYCPPSVAYRPLFFQPFE